MLILSILIIVLGLGGTIPSSIAYFSSFSTYTDGPYIGLDSNIDYLILLISSLIILALGVYVLVKVLKKKEVRMDIILLVLLAASAIVFIHNLAAMIKIIVKNIVNNKNKPFLDYLWYIIPSFVASVAFTILYFVSRKQLKNKENN